MVPTAQSTKVGLSMVVTSNNVVHVGSGLRATLTGIEMPGGAAVAVSSQDTLADLVPVRGKAISPIGVHPLGHRAYHCLTDVEKEAPTT